MVYKTWKELFTAICDAIRAKNGTTGSIDHQDIPARINSMVASGGNGGLVMVTGEVVNSAVIETGLSSVKQFVLYRTSFTSTGLMQATYNEKLGTSYVYCSSYAEYVKTCVLGSTAPTINGGTVTWAATGNGAMVDSITYKWVAVGEV